MKYFTIIIAVITLASTSLVGYLYLNPGFLLQSMPKEKAGSQITSNETKDLSSRLNKLQNELANLKNTVDSQFLLIQKLSSQGKVDSNSLASLEKKIQPPSENQEQSNVSNNQPAPELQPNISSSSIQILMAESFKDPEFSKLFQDKVEEAVKDVQKKQREEQAKRFAEQVQTAVLKRMADFAKAQNLNDYQQQEVTKIVSDRATKTMELFTKMRSEEISREEFISQNKAIRTESNDKVKQVLLPEQYTEYQKMENTFNRGLMGGRNMPQGQGTTPQSR